MSDKKNNNENLSTDTGTYGKIGLYVVIFIILLIGGIVVYLAIANNLNNNYPINIFQADQTVIIRPAVLTDLNNPNEFLSYDNNYNTYFNPNTETIGYAYGTNAIAATFTGNPTQMTSQWILRTKSLPTKSCGELDASQTITYGYGNRYYLQNAAFQANDARGRLRYQTANMIGPGMVYSSTPAVIGSDAQEILYNYFNAELLLYFLPTKYKDIYYILLPACPSYTTGFGSCQNTPIAKDSGIASIRPWSPNTPPTNNQNYGINTCDQPSNLGTFLPFYPTANQVNKNVLIMNKFDPPDVSVYDTNVYLFKITGI